LHLTVFYLYILCFKWVLFYPGQKETICNINFWDSKKRSVVGFCDVYMSFFVGFNV